MVNNLTQFLADEAATLAAGKAFAAQLNAGDVVFLQGDLGAGKTTFTRGVLQGFGVSGKVKSPTYTLVEPYVVSNFNLYHFDLYRFSDDEEWESAGFRDYFNAQSVCLVEWPEKALNLLPKPSFEIKMRLSSDAGRELNICER